MAPNRSWSEDEMFSALKEASNGQASIYASAKKYGIPKTTLKDRVKGRCDDVVGRPTFLAQDEEQAIVTYAKYLAEKGFPLTVRVVKALAHEIEMKSSRTRGEPSRFKESGPGKKWWRGFKKRHQDLTLRSPDQLDKERASLSGPGVVFEHFERLEEVLTNAKIKDKRPHLIYNTDETGVELSAKVSKVIVPRGSKRSPSRRAGTRDHISVLTCVSAAGQTIPPLIIYSKSFPGGQYTEGGPTNALYGYSDAGYINEELLKWFLHSFLKHCRRERPIMLILDQHFSHFTLRVLEAAVENNIILLGLPPHTTHFLQPLDVGIFGPLKKKWAMTVEVMQAANFNFQVTKRNFAKIFSTAYDDSVTTTIIKKSFAKTGIYPFNEDAIDDRWVQMSGKNGVDVGDSAQQTCPVQPMNGVDAGDSAQQTCPVQPMNGVDVGDSAQQTCPVQPVNGVDVGDSAQQTCPVQPMNGVDVGDSAQQTCPVQPVNGVDVGDSAQQTCPVQPMNGVDVGDIAQQTCPVQPMNGVDVGDIAQQTCPVQPVNGVDVGDSAQQTCPVQPMNGVDVGDSAQQTCPVQPMNGVDETSQQMSSATMTPNKSSYPTCKTPCPTCHPLQSPLISRLVPPSLREILVPVRGINTSTNRGARKKLSGRVLTHNEVMEEIRQKEREKREKEERKEKRKAEMVKRRQEKERKEEEKKKKIAEKQAEAQKKLTEKNERKRKREEALLARKRGRMDPEKENQGQPDGTRPSSETEIPSGSGRQEVQRPRARRKVMPPFWMVNYTGETEEED